ncbi:MAG: PD-(D/E)XK nuclease family protein, partial [Bacillota bacterium]|nr:PD-(D/E)XK nuclease family protein [Bacillota bacterium]
MLNIYYGNETIDKEKFIFQQIKGKTLLLVPDQFSLQAERDAFFYLGKKGLMDLRVLDFSTLGHKVLKEVGGVHPPLIDKYGRHMLLTKILDRIQGDLSVYKGLNWKNSFIDMVNSLISEMKRFEITPEDLSRAVEQLDENSFLKFKLEDLGRIYSVYQEAIAGKYLDSEDYITFYGEKILKAEMVAEAAVWIYGFDTFTPKNMLVIRRLLKTAQEVNIVMTYEDGKAGAADAGGLTVAGAALQSGTSEVRTDPGTPEDAAFLAADDRAELFGLTGYVIHRLSEAAEELNEEVKILPIREQAAGSDTLFKPGIWDKAPLPVTLAETSDIYREAERAAAYILKLVRDEGYRFKDMVVICNDTEIRGNALKRTFLRWGIPVFMDRKRKVLHHPAVGFLLALMEILAGGYRDQSVIRLIKSGLFPFSTDDMELLENYVRRYRIRGNQWSEIFTRGGEQFSSEELERLNEMRLLIVSNVAQAKERLGSRNKAGEKVRGLYEFLDRDFGMPKRLTEIMELQEGADLQEGAAETAQSWGILCNILDQIVETIGEEHISNRELLKLMTAGFEQMEIGIVPTDPDSVIIGTLQRTRLSRIKVLLAVGVNEGILPLEGSQEGLLSQREKETLETMDLEVSKSEEVIRQEERLAVYRTFSLPEERLYISCCRQDEAGEELHPSGIFNALRQQAEEAGGIILGDLEDEERVIDQVTSPAGTLLHMTDAFRKASEGRPLDEDWLHVLRWYEENSPESLQIVKRGMFFSNRLERLGDSFAEDLYQGNREHLMVSASQLEKYSGCPFAHFIGYGLKPDEPRFFEMGARETGDVYHECMMRFSQRLTPPVGSGTAVNDPASTWMTISREECSDQIREILETEMAGYEEGLLKAGKAEEYRTERIAGICSQIAWALVNQVRKGQIKELFFEQPFGAGKMLPPLMVEMGERQVLIRGKIDRVDVLRTEAAGESAEGMESGEGA